jgi:TolB-like protein
MEEVYRARDSKLKREVAIKVLSESGRNVPSALVHSVRHCLEKSPEQRFDSAHDIVFALQETGTGAVRTSFQAASPTARKKNVLVAAAIGMALLLGIVGIFLLRRPHKGAGEPKGPTRVAVLPFENLGTAEDDYFTDGMADKVRGKLTSLPGLQVIARGSSNPYKKTTKTPKQIAQELNVSYLLTATVRWDKDGGASRVHVSPELVDATRPDTELRPAARQLEVSKTGKRREVEHRAGVNRLLDAGLSVPLC